MTTIPRDEACVTVADGNDPAAAYKRLAEFLAGRVPDRVFACPIRHPSDPTGFCYCEHSFIKAALFLVRAMLFGIMTHCPSNGARAWFLRRFGAKVGSNVTISPGVWIDPTFPQLLTFEDNVFIGAGAKITTHEYRMTEFRAGRVILREGALIGGFAIIGCGVEIGWRATVGAGSVVGRDVPAGATVIGNPPRIVSGRNEEPSVRS